MKKTAYPTDLRLKKLKEGDILVVLEKGSATKTVQCVVRDTGMPSGSGPYFHNGDVYAFCDDLPMRYSGDGLATELRDDTGPVVSIIRKTSVPPKPRPDCDVKYLRNLAEVEVSYANGANDMATYKVHIRRSHRLLRIAKRLEDGGVVSTGTP